MTIKTSIAREYFANRTVRCTICEGECERRRPYTFTSKAFRSVYQDKYVYRCTRCGCVQADTVAIDEAALTDYYQNHYRTAAVAIGQSTNDAAEAYYHARAAALLGLARKHYSGKAASIFEVGAGYGYNLLAFADEFPGASLYTDEPSQVVSRDPRIQTRGLSEGPYDIIIMSHVVEHFTDPKALLETALASLSPDGVIVIEVPNDVANIVTINGRDEPHLLFFTLPTFKKLLDQVQGKVVDAYVAGPSYLQNTLKMRLRRIAVDTAAKLPITSRIIAKGRARTAEQALLTKMDFSQQNPMGNVLRAAIKRV